MYQSISRPIVTVETKILSQVSSYGSSGKQAPLEQAFIRVLWFPHRYNSNNRP